MTARPAVADVLVEDRLLWQFWINKGLESAPLAARLADLGPDTQWDYLAGNALYGGFEADLLRSLRMRAAAPPGATVPAWFLDSLRGDAEGSRQAVTPSTPEGRLLVLCASPKMSAAEEAEASGLASASIEWTAFVQAAARGNLTLAVQHNLARLALDARLPLGLDLVLARRARGIAARNRRMTALLEEIRRVLGAEGIRPILLKETALALTHYGDGRLRMMGDIDLLFEESEIDRVVRLLEALGCSSVDVIWTKEHYRTRHHHIAPLGREDLGAKIEPHRTIALPVPEPSGLVAAMAARAVTISDGCRAFTPTDTLFHLSMDLFGGAFIGKIGQLCDAREVVRQGGVDWQALQATAESAGAGAHLAFALDMMKDIDAPVPDEMIAGLKRGNPPAFAAGRLSRMAERNLFGYVPSRATLSRPAQTLLFLALMMPDGWPARIGFLIKSYLYVGSDEGMGGLARGARPSRGRALGRMLTLPVRAVRRWTGSRRMP